MSIEDAVRLRQFRHDGMIKWQVPTIISLLPVLVQLSVICFLTGLLLYLRTINGAVAITFAAVAGPLVFIFIITALCPIIWPSCPYKSPLIPTLWTLIQWCIIPVLVAGGLFVCAGILMGFSLLLILWHFAFSNLANPPKKLIDFASWFDVLQDVVIVRLYHIARRISSGSLYYNNERFWTSRERATIRKYAKLLDVRAFEWAPIGVQTHRLKEVVECLSDLPRSDRVRAALRWAAIELDCFPFDLNTWFSLQYPCHPNIISLFRPQSISRLWGILAVAFAPEPHQGGSYNWTHIGGPVEPMSSTLSEILVGPNKDRGGASGGSALALLYMTTMELPLDQLAELMAVDNREEVARMTRTEELESFVRTVMGLRRCQDIKAMADLHWRWPTVFLYLCAERGFVFDEDGWSHLAVDVVTSS